MVGGAARTLQVRGERGRPLEVGRFGLNFLLSLTIFILIGMVRIADLSCRPAHSLVGDRPRLVCALGVSDTHGSTSLVIETFLSACAIV